MSGAPLSQARPEEGELASLLAPLAADVFFATYYEKQPAHLKGSPARGQALLDRERLLEALTAGIPDDTRLHLNNAAWGADAGQVAELSPAERGQRLRAYLDAGHPLMWNAARDVSPAVTRACAVLSHALRAAVWPNIYATGPAGTAFQFHFDAHEVIAVQCEGIKTWQISKRRADRPLDDPGLADAVVQVLQQQRAAAQTELAMELTVEAGDVVYIPRGQFHNAYAPHGPSLHVTFAIEPLSGYDVVKALAGLALADPFVRQYLPPPALDPSGAATAAYLEQLRLRLAHLAGSAPLRRELDEELDRRVQRNSRRVRPAPHQAAAVRAPLADPMAGRYAVVRLLDDDNRRLLAQEAHARTGEAARHGKDEVASDQQAGGADCRLLTGPAGPLLQAFVESRTLLQVLERLTGECWTPRPPMRAGGEYTYTYYAEPGDYLGLHRDVKDCELSVITCVDDQPGEGGDLVLYAARLTEPLSAIRATPDQGCVRLRLQPGESLVLFGAEIPHCVTAIGPGRTRISAGACYGRVRA